MARKPTKGNDQKHCQRGRQQEQAAGRKEIVGAQPNIARAFQRAPDASTT